MSYDPHMEPIPVQPLEYADPQRTPGLVVALGVIGLIVACLTFLANGVLTLWCFGLYIANTTPIPTVHPVPSVPAANAPTQSAAELVVDPQNGMDWQQRQIVIAGLFRKRILSQPRQTELDNLLRQNGKRIFPFSGALLTMQSVSANVSQSARLPGSENQPGPDCYILGLGRLEVYDDHAVFYPTDGTPPLRTPSASPGAESQLDTTVNPAPTVTFAPAPPFDGTFVVAAVVEAAVSVCLAGLLIVAAILALRRSHRGGRWHRVYAWIKLPLALVGIGLWWKAFADLFDRLYNGLYTLPSPPPGYGTVPGIIAAVPAFLGLVYAVAVLLALRARSVREYYR